MSGLQIELPEELLDAIAERVLNRLAEQNEPGDRRNEPGDRWLRGADEIAAHIGAPRSRVYALAACKPPRIPVVKDGSALLAKRSELHRWLRNGGGTRP